jgi:hypothetical protein
MVRVALFDFVIVAAVLAVVVGLLGSRYYRVVLGVLGAVVACLVGMIALYGLMSRHESAVPLRVATSAQSDEKQTMAEWELGGRYRVGNQPAAFDESRSMAEEGVAEPLLGQPLSAEQPEDEQPPAATQPPSATQQPRDKQTASEQTGSAQTASEQTERASATAGGDVPNTSSLAPRQQRPWLVVPTGRQSDGSYQVLVTSGPYKTRIECDAQLRPIVAQEVDQYVELLLGREDVRRALGEGFRGSTLLTPSEQDALVRQTWLEHGEASYPVGEVVTVHALVVFTPQVQRRIEVRFREQVVQQRMWQVMIGSGSLLGLLAAVYGYLRLDTLTRGYYTGRLRLAAAATILAIVGGAAAYFLG